MFETKAGSNGKKVSATSSDDCIQCGYCLSICPADAISHETVCRNDFIRIANPDIKPDTMEKLIFSRRSTRCFKEKKILRKNI